MESTTSLPIFQIKDAPVKAGARWFVRQGDNMDLGQGFASKQQASDWIESLGFRVDWRVGYLFRLRGDNVDTEIVDRAGKRATP